MKLNTKLILIFILQISAVLFAQKPKIRIIATGGTIAGVSKSSTESSYKAGAKGIDELLQAVPEIHQVAQVSGEQLVKIGSQDMNDEIWLKLAKRINEILNKEGYDGVVVTHGTDTMEETAYFLNLTVHSSKPVVMVGAMRPFTGISADGPLNLYNAVVAASDKNTGNKGVVVVMNENILDAKDVIKHHMVSLTSLPKVGIVYGYANASELPMKAFIDAKYDGIIYAGVGNGNLYHSNFDLAVKAQKQGIQIVRSSRVPTGATTPDAEVEDAKYHFVASQSLNPQKSRVLLMLALTKTKDWKQIQKYFNEY